MPYTGNTVLKYNFKLFSYYSYIVSWNIYDLFTFFALIEYFKVTKKLQFNADRMKCNGMNSLLLIITLTNQLFLLIKK